MTNMNYRKDECKTLFRWEKEWIRPYESEYSVIANFCKVNVMSPRHMYSLFGVYGGTEPVNNRETKRKNYDTLYRTLFPEGFYDHSLTVMGEKRCLVVCPICMAGGYHSYLHNLRGAVTCPFHKTKLIKTDLQYNIFKSITCSDSRNDASNILFKPHPALNQSIAGVDIGRFPDVEEIFLLNTKNAPPNHAVKPFVGDTAYSRIIKAKPCADDPKTYEEFLYGVIEEKAPLYYYPGIRPGCQNIRINRDFLKQHESQYNQTVWRFDYFNSLCLYAKIISLALKSRMRLLDYNKIQKDFHLISSPSESEITGAFLWYVTGFSDPGNLLNANWVFNQTYHIERSNLEPNYPTIISREQDAVKSGSHMRKLLIALVMDDLMDYAYNSFRHRVKTVGVLNPRDDWKYIPQPEYYCIHYKNDPNWTILRYDE